MTPKPNTDEHTVIHSPAITGDVPAIGDVTAPIPDAPAMTPAGGVQIPDEGGEIVYSQSRAAEGPRCIARIGGNQWVTYLEAERLARQYAEVAMLVRDQRRIKGGRE